MKISSFLSSLIITLFAATFFAGCAHNNANKTEARQPAAGLSGPQKLSEFGGSSPAPNSAWAANESHLPPTANQEIARMVRERDEKRMAQLLWSVSVSQSMTSAFDDGLSTMTTADQVDGLLASNFYCKVQSARAAHEGTNDWLIESFRTAVRSAPHKDWAFEQLNTFAQKSRLNEVSIIHLARNLTNHEMDICGAKDCVRNEISKMRFQVNPFDDEAFARYSQDHRKEIAKYSAIKPADMKPGACFGESRMPAQASDGYDWKNRNWIGSNPKGLDVGQFVITYDDGPDNVHTEQIKAVWANAGMAKPAFFWLASRVKSNPEIVRLSSQQGYSLGSHSERHADLGAIARASSLDEIGKTNRALFGSNLPSSKNFRAWRDQTLDREINQSINDLSSYAGYPVHYFRLPYGSGVRASLIGQRFQAMNLDHFFWRVDSLDWQDTNPSSIRDRVVAQMKAVQSGIVLFHDIHPQSVKASALLVQFLKSNPSYKAAPFRALKGLQP